MKSYDIRDWYWIVSLDATHVYSSKLRNYVLTTDPTYTDWASDGSVATPIDTEANLGGIFASLNAFRPIPPAVLDGYLDAQLLLIAQQPDFSMWVDLYKQVLSLGSVQQVLGHIRTIL